MYSLYLTRHAKSSWDDQRMDDFNRPLNARGERDAPFMAKRFKERGEPVTLIVSSPALRAITTARTFARTLGIADEVFVSNKEIYLAPQNMLLRIVNLLPADKKQVMLFGHNPGFSELVEYLSDEDIGEMPTCATVRLDFALDSWGEVSLGLGTMRWYDFPKQYAELR